MSLSVLTLVKNRTAHLDQLVEGLRRSARSPDELVIIDMSDRPVPTPVTAFPTRIFRLETDGLPLARARNRAAGQATGDLLLFLDVDCIPARGLVAAVEKALSEQDALICADVRYLRADQARQGWTEEDLLATGLSHPIRTFPDEGLVPEANAGLFWSLAFGLRRRTFDALGGFDEAFTGYGAEDTDFGFRARDAGLPLMFMGGAGAFHQHHGVIDPPLQHFDDILRNAATFRHRWNVWPMQGWLKAFETAGLIRMGPDQLERLRSPEAAEISAATRPDAAF